MIGHRGAPGYRPEHTRSSYDLALRMGVDAVEPDVVVSRDGVLVVRHDNELSTTTDVADRPEFAALRTTKTVDGAVLDGWFAEDLTWAELATLRCRERLPVLRPASAAHDDTEGVLRLDDVLGLVATASRAQQREIGVVIELKHATYLDRHGWDLADLLAAELARASARPEADRIPLTIESFESTVLARLRPLGLPLVYLVEADGAPHDGGPPYADAVSAVGLDLLAGVVDGISVDKAMILDRRGLVADAHARGLSVFTWTCRPENTFLAERFRIPGREFGDYASEWAEIRDAGIDGVFVDHPDFGVRVFADGGARVP